MSADTSVIICAANTVLYTMCEQCDTNFGVQGGARRFLEINLRACTARLQLCTHEQTDKFCPQEDTKQVVRQSRHFPKLYCIGLQSSAFLLPLICSAKLRMLEVQEKYGNGKRRGNLSSGARASVKKSRGKISPPVVVVVRTLLSARFHSFRQPVRERHFATSVLERAYFQIFPSSKTKQTKKV